jgi:hypothetical protein
MPPSFPKTSVVPANAGVDKELVLTPWPKSKDQINAPVVRFIA